MSSTHPQPTVTTESSPTTIPTSDTRKTQAGAPATFDTGCRRRLACLIDAENQSVSPAHGTRPE